MKQPELKDLIKEEIRQILKEAQYLINIEYQVPRNFYNDPMEVLKTQLHFNQLLDSYEIKSASYEDKNFVAYIKVISKVSKSELQKNFDERSLRSEKYIIN